MPEGHSEIQAGGGGANGPAAGASLYVNYFEVGQNPYEFLLELGQYRPGQSGDNGSILIHTRIATAPSYAKLLSGLLERAVREHEAANGTIPAFGEAPDSPFDIVLRSLPEFEARAERARAAPMPPLQFPAAVQCAGPSDPSDFQHR
jgi:hypothetical protein